MSKDIEKFNENFCDKDILSEYENLNKEEVEIVSRKLDDINLRSKIHVCIDYKYVYMKKNIIESVAVYEDYTKEVFNMSKEDIKRLEQVKEELDKFYEIFSSGLNLSASSHETHYNPNNKEILIGVKEQIIDFIILSGHCGLSNIIGEQAISYLSFLLYHEYYHYLFDELKLGDSNLIDREVLTKDEIYFKIISKYKNEKMAWKFAKEWIGSNLDDKVLNTIINVSMLSYSKGCKKALDQLSYPYSDFVNVMGIVLLIDRQ